MIHGIVTYDNQAVVRLAILGNGIDKEEVEAVIDTGFNGSLSLSRTIISNLQLLLSGQAHSELADGTKRFFDIYEGVVVWDGEERLINIHEADAIPLVGMSLLTGYQLKIDVEHEGPVTIQRLVELSS